MGVELRRRWGTLLAAGLMAAACSQHYEEGAHPPPKPAPRTQLPAGHPPMPQGDGAAVTPGEAPEGAVTGTIRLAPELAGEVPSRAVLFVIARERADGGPPYAVKRLPVPSFPFPFTLSQADVIPMFGEGLQFADIPEMYISARIDRDGSVGEMESGDLEGTVAEPVAAGDSGVDILIDTRY